MSSSRSRTLKFVLLWCSIFLSTFALNPPACCRREFLFKTTIHWTASPLLLTTNSPVSLQTAPNTPFVYSDTWTGTNLPLVNIAEAAAATAWPMARWPDPILRRPADPVESHWFGTPQLQRACALLQATARQNQAVGLAAQQCGVNARIVFLEPNHLVLINPHIVQRSPEVKMRVWKEQCLVLPPTFSATVLRDAVVTVEYQDASSDGAWKSVTLHGEMARAVQHELDHDRGILVTDHVDLSELENDIMRSIETPGHDYRMELAYMRRVDETALGTK